jgi:hypothetical protein
MCLIKILAGIVVASLTWCFSEFGRFVDDICQVHGKKGDEEDEY